MRRSQARKARSQARDMARLGVSSLDAYREAKEARKRAVRAEIRSEIETKWAEEVGRVIDEKGEWLGLDGKGRTIRATRAADGGFCLERMP